MAEGGDFVDGRGLVFPTNGFGLDIDYVSEDCQALESFPISWFIRNGAKPERKEFQNLVI